MIINEQWRPQRHGRPGATVAAQHACLRQIQHFARDEKTQKKACHEDERPAALARGQEPGALPDEQAPRVESDLRVPAALVATLPDRLREAQAAFEATGGLHATGLFSSEGQLLCVREDVGRHNALDKVVGRAFLDGLLPLSRSILCVSGRISFELVQKAAVAGCPLLVAVGAPSSLAVELAADRGLTLCGFVRGGSLNVYTETWRIT